MDRHQADAAGYVADQAADQRGARPASGLATVADAASGDEQRQQWGQYAQVLTMQRYVFPLRITSTATTTN